VTNALFEDAGSFWGTESLQTGDLELDHNAR